jgi:ABC-type cobalt transport system substrate-binding protein
MTEPAQVGELLRGEIVDLVERWDPASVLELGGVQPEHSSLGKEQGDHHRGKWGGADAPAARQVPFAQPEYPPDRGNDQVSDSESEQQRSHLASIAGALVVYTLAARRGRQR